MGRDSACKDVHMRWQKNKKCSSIFIYGSREEEEQVVAGKKKKKQKKKKQNVCSCLKRGETCKVDPVTKDREEMNSKKKKKKNLEKEQKEKLEEKGELEQLKPARRVAFSFKGRESRTKEKLKNDEKKLGEI